ncbi:MAG: hypothetical protein GXP46_10485 [Deferribacteres bacterium]|nr:hypothetical protein [Deferribacteres bacterium]
MDNGFAGRLSCPGGISMRLQCKFSMVIVFIFIISAPPAVAMDTDVIRSDEVIVRFEKPLRDVALEVTRIYPSVRRELETALQSGIGFIPEVILMSDREKFLNIAGNRLVVAVAVPGKNLIVIDNSEMKTFPYSLRVTLKHELSHLLLHEHVGKGELPRWLNEGIAQWVSGGMAEILSGKGQAVLEKAVLSGRLIPIRELTLGFPDDAQLLRLSYEESRSFVEYIIKKSGIQGILGILNNLRDGDGIDTAVIRAVSIPLYELEAEWHEYLRRKFTWFVYFSSRIYEIIFAVGALFLVYGFIKVLIRKRAYKDTEDEDE